MDNDMITTPFGRRSMTLGMLKNQMAAQNTAAGGSVDKWKLYRLLCEARPLLGVTDRALSLLNALLSFYPKQELTDKNGLVVFPSNAQLSLRAHGMAEQTIRRHITLLIKAGLLIRKDSPNGKRYAHKDRAGGINEAFGFSLAPLLARFDEIERMANQVVAERLRLQRLKERLTLCRRDIQKLVDTAINEAVKGDWSTVREHLATLLEKLPRVPNSNQLETILLEVEALRDEVINQLETQLKIVIEGVNPPQNERHIQNSDSESLYESERKFGQRQNQVMEIGLSGEKPRSFNRPTPEASTATTKTLKSFPLELVLQATPQIYDYGPGGRVSTWRDLMSAAGVVRSMLGVSATAYEQACAVMGSENTATIVACILERGSLINSAGGYLRDLTHRALKNEFALGPMLMALLRSRDATVAGAAFKQEQHQRALNPS